MNHLWHPYCGTAPVPAEIASRWNFDPVLLTVFAAGALAFLFALPRERRGPSWTLWGTVGLSLLLFVSPFCALTSALFSARVVHHLALTILLAPLVALALPRFSVRGPGALWIALHVTIFWLWHAPAAYSAALSNHTAYWAMQLSITGSAIAFWVWLRQASLPSAVGGLLVTTVAMGLLGALLTFAGQPLYAPHFDVTAPWGLSALEDQQLAGLIMWAPGGGFYLAAALMIAARWLRRGSAKGVAA